MKWLIDAWRRYWKRFRYVVHIDSDPYLIRYRIIQTPWLCIYLHHILRSDADRECHDHPFDFISIVLWGGYKEHRYWPTSKANFGKDVVVHRRMGSIRFRRATDFHRVELYGDRTNWSLFIRGPRTRDWGFHVPPLGWMDYRVFELYKRATICLMESVSRRKLRSYVITRAEWSDGKACIDVDMLAGEQFLSVTDTGIQWITEGNEAGLTPNDLNLRVRFPRPGSQTAAPTVQKENEDARPQDPLSTP